MKLEKKRVLPIIRAALKEDIGSGDITTGAVTDNYASCRAMIVTREDCVVCGLDIAEWTMNHVDYSVRFKPNCRDGDFVGKDKEIAFLEGHASAILRSERTILNFLALLGGISTKTRQFVDKTKQYGVKIMDTRKTMPLLRYLEKYAVSAGGGFNHRMGLYDQVLIKDNHIKVIGNREPGTGNRGPGAGLLKKMVEAARKKNAKGAVIEIEVGGIEEFNDALLGKPDIVMLDNMSPHEVRSCAEIRRLSSVKPLLEVSGGVTLENVEEYAKTKVDMISIGSLTSSVRSIDMALDMI
jgi:nicotinate-nucleotide pyrophosphorylase (carboxylating)